MLKYLSPAYEKSGVLMPGPGTVATTFAWKKIILRVLDFMKNP